MENKIVAGIVTFNPVIERLKQNIEAIIPQVEELIIVDNASQNIAVIDSFCHENGVRVLKNTKNLGVAVALNQIFSYFAADDAGGGYGY